MDIRGSHSIDRWGICRQIITKIYAFCQLPIKQKESTCFWKMYSKPPYDIFVISVYFVLCVFFIPWKLFILSTEMIWGENLIWNRLRVVVVCGVCAYIHGGVHACMHACMYTYLHVRVCVCVHMSMYACVCI